MSSVVISGDTSGAITVSAPAVSGTNTLTLQAATATNSVNTLATAVASTSGTSIDFTSLPSWIKKITVMFNSVSTNGSSFIQVQLGSGSFTTSGYYSAASDISTIVSTSTSTTGLLFTKNGAAADIRLGAMTITNISGNIWISTSTSVLTNAAVSNVSAGNITLSGTIDRLRITTVNGTDTFDAGSVNILYEG